MGVQLSKSNRYKSKNFTTDLPFFLTHLKEAFCKGFGLKHYMPNCLKVALKSKVAEKVQKRQILPNIMAFHTDIVHPNSGS